MDYIIYNGIDSRTFGVYLVRRGNTPLEFDSIPPSRVKTEKIAGKHGTIAVEQLYEPRQIDVELYFTDTSHTMLRKIAGWLGKIGTHQLIKSTEPYKYYNATFEQGMNPEIHGLKQGIVSLTFTAYDPFGYSTFTTLELESGVEYDSGLFYDSGIDYADLTTYSYTETVPFGGDGFIPVLQGGNADFALPKITLTAGIDPSGGFKLEHYYGGKDPEHKIGECTYSAGIPAESSVIIDSQINDVYDENGDILSANFDGDFFVFKGVGNPEFEIRGNIVAITTTTITLDANASAVDDFYNGKIIAIIGNKEIGTQYAEITDYDGTTKVATISKPIEENSNDNLMYMIYDFSDKLNYIKYSYSSPVIAIQSTITFDFRFNYL